MIVALALYPGLILERGEASVDREASTRGCRAANDEHGYGLVAPSA